MKALFIGGTGTISSAISSLAIEKGVELTLLTRSGNGPEGAERLICDVNDEDRAFSVLKGRSFDVVVDFVAFRPERWNAISASFKSGPANTSLSAPPPPIKSRWHTRLLQRVPRCTTLIGSMRATKSPVKLC